MFDPFAIFTTSKNVFAWLTVRGRWMSCADMLGEPLQFDPGKQMVRSNFGYCVLGRVIEKVSGKPYATYISEEIFRPLGVDDVRLARSVPRDRHEVWYPVKDVVVEVADSYGGLVATAPDLCKFLEAYWANGDPRQAGEDRQWAFVGNFSGTTAFIRQRPDGYNMAILFNGRRGESLQDEDDRSLAARRRSDGQSRGRPLEVKRPRTVPSLTLPPQRRGTKAAKRVNHRRMDMNQSGSTTIGEPLARVDGMAKVTGTASFAADFAIPGLVHATLVMSTIASGRVSHIDTASAERSPGVLAVITPQNASAREARATADDPPRRPDLL